MKNNLSKPKSKKSLGKDIVKGINSILRSILQLVSFLGEIIYELVEYFITRLRLIGVIIQAIAEVLMDEVGVVKDWFVKRMFWGRGRRYRHFAQISIIIIVGIIIFIASYNTPVTNQVLSYQEYTYTTEVAQKDLLVESGSLETLTPEDRIPLEMREYVVKKGDKLSLIAAEFNVRTQTIQWANNMSSAHVIRPGQKLKIPPGDGLVVKVEKGDSVESLANEYDISSQAIAEVNWLNRDLSLSVGQKLFLPNAEKKQEYTASGSSNTSSSGYVDNTDNSSGGNSQPPPTTGKFLRWPVASSAKVSQCSYWYHVAIDLSNKSAPNVVAAANGTVTFSGWSSNGYGYNVKIDHGNGYSTLYAHMQSLYVTSGSYVNAGDAIGKMGSTGLSTGTHLHFELRQGGSKLYPAGYINKPSYIGSLCGY
jgi:murein DD-endopeptidase MepM/ murein hydrolase activator NlpD